MECLHTSLLLTLRARLQALQAQQQEEAEAQGQEHVPYSQRPSQALVSDLMAAATRKEAVLQRRALEVGRGSAEQ